MEGASPRGLPPLTASPRLAKKPTKAQPVDDIGFDQMEEAALRIQKSWRGHKARVEAAEMRQDKGPTAHARNEQQENYEPTPSWSPPREQDQQDSYQPSRTGRSATTTGPPELLPARRSGKTPIRQRPAAAQSQSASNGTASTRQSGGGAAAPRRSQAFSSPPRGRAGSPGRDVIVAGPTADEVRRRKQMLEEREEARLREMEAREKAAAAKEARAEAARLEAIQKRKQELAAAAAKRKENTERLMERAGQVQEPGSAAAAAAADAVPMYKRIEEEWRAREAEEAEAARLELEELLKARGKNPRPRQVMSGQVVVRPRNAAGGTLSPTRRPGTLSVEQQAKLPTHFIHPDTGAPINRQTMEVPVSSTGLMAWQPSPKEAQPRGGRPNFDGAATREQLQRSASISSEQQELAAQAEELLQSMPKNPRPRDIMGGDAVVRPAMRQSTASLHRSLSPDVQAKLPTFFIHPDAGAPINRQTMEVPLSSTGLMPWLPHPKDGPLPGNRPPFDSSAAVPTSFVTPHKSTRVPGRAA